MSNVVPLKPGAAGAVRRILMVEDDANDAELLQACLAKACPEGSVILHARTLAEGLALQRAHEVQLTLLDLDLPDSSGFGTLERMRAAASGPVVVVSGNSHPALVDEALARRAYDVIPKDELDAATLRRVLRLATLHHEAGRALRATEGRLRALVENSAEALVLFDAAGRIEYASASLRRALGYDAAEVIGRNGLMFVQEEDRRAVQEAFPRLVAAEDASVTMRVRFVHKDGSARLLEATLVNRLADAEVVAIVCSFRDLTREEEQRARFDAAFDNAAVGMAHVDLDGRILLANRRLGEMLGYAREALAGRTMFELSHPEDADATSEERAQLHAGAIPHFAKRKRYLRSDGGVLWAQITVAAERDAQGLVRYETAAFEDVGEQVRAEERLRASEARLRAIIGAEPECVKVLDDAGLLLDMNPAGLAMIEADSLATVAGQCVYNLVTPASRGAFRALTERACRGERGILEFEVVGLKGTRRWMETHAVPLRDETGRALMLGITRDITERKAAELALRESEARFRSLTELSSDWYWEQDAEYRFTRFDGGAGDAAWGGDQSKSLGLQRWEIPGLSPLNCTWEEHRALLDARKPFRGVEYLRLTDQGERRYVTTSGEPVFGADGAFLGYRGTAADITERKTAELAVRESESRFRSLTELSSDYYWETDAEHRLSLRGSGGTAVARSTFGPGGGVGQRRWELPFKSPDMDGWMAHKAVLDQHEPFAGFEFSRPTPEGGERFFSITGGPVYDAEGRFAGYRGVGSDITARKLAERRLRLEHEVARILAAAPDARAGLQGAIRVVCETEVWDCGRYFEVDAGAGLLRHSEAWGVDDPEVRRFLEDSRGMTLARGDGLAGRVWDSGEPAWVADIRKDARVSPRGLAIMGEMRGAFVFPVTLHSGTVGVLAISGREVREPDAALLRTMATVGNQLGQFLSRQRAEEATRRSEERFRSLTKMSSDFYWETDAAHRFTQRGTGAKNTAVPAFRDGTMFGKTRWELPFVKPDMAGWMAHKAVLDAHLPFRDFEFSRLGADGAEHAIVISGEPVFDGAGNFTGYRGVGSDITERKLAERRVHLEHQVAQLLAAAPEARSALRGVIRTICETEGWDCGRYFEVDAGANLLRYSEGWGVDDPEVQRFLRETRVLTHRPGEGVRGMVWQSGEPIWVADVRNDPRVTARAQATLGEIRGAFVAPVSAGATVVGVLSISSRVMRQPDERLLKAMGVIGSQLGQFLQKTRGEQALRDSEERFRNLTELSSDWYWEQDAEFRFTKFGMDASSPVYGTQSEPLGKTRWELPLTPLSSTFEQHRETLRAHRTFRDFEYSYAGADGKTRYVAASGYPVHDAEGRFLGYRGIARDITPRMQSEARMRVHAERQAAIAGFGQFAIGRRSTEELYTEAARALRCEGVDAVCLLEMHTERREFLVRAAQGEGPHASVGLTGPVASDSVWPEILRENASRIAGREYLAGRPIDRPWRAWLHGMGSAVYTPVRDDEKPIAMLCMYAVREQAFGADDVRFAESMSHVLSTALQRQKAEERLARMAQFDALTGLPNRTLLQDRLGQTIVQSRRRQLHAGVLFVDLDRFKLVNDTLGHHQGDALIRQVGQRLLACVRPGDTVGRISGDEFAVVLADMARPDDAALVGQKMLESLAVPFDLGGNEAYVTGSIGIAVYPGDGGDAETLLKNADMAMYRAKESARNSYCFFTAEMNQRSVAKVQLNADLRHALERDEFALHYQPKLDLATGELRGLEALLRWNHPSRGLVSPAEFIPALEDSGLIVPVGEWVVEQACRQLRLWTAAGLAPLPVAVNLSPKQFRRRDLDALIRNALVRSGISAEFLELEITESCLMDNPEDAVRAMHNLRAAGLRISIDDFGTGYSSLSYLTRLPLSALKIDRSFVRDSGTSAESASIVRAIIDMAQNLHLTVIAEGVETEEQAAFLRREGCHQAQGFLYSRPLPAAEIAARLAPAG